MDMVYSRAELIAGLVKICAQLGSARAREAIDISRLPGHLQREAEGCRWQVARVRRLS